MANFVSKLGLLKVSLRSLTTLLTIHTGKSLSETLIFASTNPHYHERLFIVHENCKLRIPAEHCCFCFDIQNNFGTHHVLQMLQASEKDLHVRTEFSKKLLENKKKVFENR